VVITKPVKISQTKTYSKKRKGDTKNIDGSLDRYIHLRFIAEQVARPGSIMVLTLLE
jgi:hypothetical protein